MEFNGFEILPVGNAQMSVQNGILKVTDILDSGLDGILIRTETLESYTINFGDLSSIVNRKGVLKTTALRRNPIGHVTPLIESFKWYDQNLNKVLSGYNLNYLPESFIAFGKLNGKIVYEIDSSQINPSQPKPMLLGLAIAGLVVAVASLAVAVWSTLRTKETQTVTTNYDAQGHVTGYTVSVSKDPVPFEVEVNGKAYTVDEFGIRYNIDYPTDLIGNPIMEYSNIAEMITGYNLSSFEITSITSI